jgi:hypothetical protein
LQPFLFVLRLNFELTNWYLFVIFKIRFFKTFQKMKKHILSIVTILLLSSNAFSQNFFIQEDFNASNLPSGWTNTTVTGTNAWIFGLDGSATNPGVNNLDGTPMAYFDDDGLGGGNVNSRADLLTDVFDNSASAYTLLEFDYNFREFAGPLDSFIVAVYDGANWIEVFATGTNDCGNYIGACLNILPKANIDISAYANATCQIKFTYYDGDDWCWYVGIDNVAVSSPFPNDIGADLITGPISTCGLSSAQTVQVMLKNFGSLPATGFDVVLDTSGAVVLTETVGDTIPPGDSLNYTFTGTIDLQRIAFYDVMVYTNQLNDGNTSNDSTAAIIENQPFFTPTYTDNFEGVNRWKVEGQNASWMRGIPASATLNTATSGTNAYVTNLSGVYNTNEISYLVSPCFNFSSGLGDPIISFNLNYKTEATYDRLTFQYSTDGGVTWQIVNSGGVNPTNWFTNNAQFWEGNSGGWIPVENVLAGLGGQSAVNFRFAFTSDGSGVQEGIGVDDFSVRYPQPIDISANSINYPSTSGASLCGYASESIIVELENKGASAIDTVFVFYKVDNLAAVRDTLIGPLASNTLTTFSFSQKANFSIARNYNVDVWAVATNDGFNPNDSLLNRTIVGGPSPTSLSLPVFENFDGFGWVRGNASGNNSIIPFPWVRTPTPGASNFTWHPWNGGTGSFNTGPINDHTGNGGNYMFIETSFPASTALPTPILESPCINLGSASGAIMEFWYHKFGATMGDLFVEVNDGSNWTQLLRINGQTQTAQTDPWLKATVNLNRYAGQRIKLRWRGTYGGSFTGDMAIDDIEIFEPIPQDAKVATLVSPVSGCTPSGNIIAKIENFGSAPLTNIPVAFSIDNGTIIRDTVTGTLAPGDKVNHNFSVSGNFAVKGRTYNITVWTEVFGDSNLFNDRISVDVINTTRNVDFFEDFEGFTDGDCGNNNATDILGAGWTQGVSSGSLWHVQDMTACGDLPGFNTGPDADHTSGTGNLMYLNGTGFGQLESPCIDFKSRAGAAMRFWYHKWGANMNTLFVDIFADGVWNNGVFSIPGQTHTSTAAPWLEAVAKFNQFGGKDLQVRFRGNGNFQGQMAIDDISFFAPAGYDARMLAVTGPESGCSINGMSSISVELDNFGVNTINSFGDSLFVYYQIDSLPPVKDTVNAQILSEQSIQFTFSTPADLSKNGKTYNVKAWTSLIGEEDFDNDTLYFHKIINSTRITDYYENFETFRDASCTEQLGQVLQNGWTETSDGGYNWQVQSSLCGKGSSTTPTAVTGPNGDRTTGNGLFLFVEASNGGGTATFESPCLDLAGNTNPRLSFWYHRFGANMNDLSIDVLFNGIWVNGVSILTGQSQTSASDNWKQWTVDLSPYTGGLVQVRFKSVRTGFGGRGDMAIDDIFLYEAIANDAGITEIIQPTGDACGLTVGAVVVKIENFGTADINPGELSVQYNNNGGVFEVDTIQQTILAGANLIYTFSTQMDLSNPGRQLITANTILPNDSLPQNNRAFKTVTNRQPGIPRYLMDFEDLVMGLDAAGDPVYNGDQLAGFVRTPRFGATGIFMWHVVSGAGPYIDGQPPMPAGPSTGPSGDHTFANNRINGRGTYVLMETDLKQLEFPNPNAIPDATLELPCGPIDLTTSKNGSVLFSYWYHMFGPETGNLYVDVYNGISWVLGVNVIRGAQHFDDTDPWSIRKVVLDRFVGLDSVRIRLRAETGYNGNLGSGRGGDIAVDDMEILDRAKKDASAFALMEPASDCGLTATENFRIRIQNLGTEDILSVNLAYQITFTPYGGNPQAMPVVRDSSIGQTIVPLAFYNFSFDDLDMSAPGKYFIKYWTDYRGDEHRFNDTLTELITNTARPFPSCDNFSDLVFGTIGKEFKDGILPNDWDANEQAYTFVASVEGNPDVPELKGHTGGLNDVFLLAVDPNPFGGNAEIESACWDLNNTPAANLEFWYVMPSASGQLEIAVNRDGGGFQPIDTIKGAEGVARVWRKYEAVLADFVGANVQVQFRTLSPGGTYYAIDDVCIISPEPQQILFNEFVNPFVGRCFYGDQEPISIRVRNIGIDVIDSFQVVIALDEDIIGNPRGANGWRDTTWVRPGLAPPFFNPGELFTFTLNDPNFLLDLSEYKDYFIHALILLDGDADTTNNIRLDYQITHGDPEDLPYVEDFETPTLLNISGPHPLGYAWELGPAWLLDQGDDPALPPGNGFGISGPELDHTLGPADTTGSVLTSVGASSNLGSAIFVTSPCIDLINTISPEMKFWYHMFGFSMGRLTLQINDDFGWVTVQTLTGQEPLQQRGGRTAWQARIIDLSAYVGKVIKYRFISECGDNFASNMAIDDIAVYDAAAIDIAPVSLNEPNIDSTQCYSEKNPLRVDIVNNGSDSLNFENDTVAITVAIFKDVSCDGNFVLLNTLTQKFFANNWVNENGETRPLPRDSIITLSMDSTFDMSDTGDCYRFVIVAEVDGDLISSNNVIGSGQQQIIIKSQRKIGTIYSSEVLPNDTICYQDQVSLTVRDYFGAVTWEISEIEADSSSFGFFPDGGRGSFHSPLLDSTSDFRARTCVQLFTSEGIDETSDSVRIEVLKPYRAQAFGGYRCENDPIKDSVKVILAPNISGVNYYAADPSNRNPVLPPILPIATIITAPYYYDLKQRMVRTDTFYVETFIAYPNILPDGLLCVVKPAGSIPGIVPVERVIATLPVLPFTLEETLEFCGPGSGSILEQGRIVSVDLVPFRRDTYSWTFEYPGELGGRVVADTVTTSSFAIDPWRMNVNKSPNSFYTLSVDVVTDSNCRISAGTDSTIFIKILEDCTSGMEESGLFKEFEIYPNPVSDVLMVSHTSVDFFNGSIYLVSMEGKLIESFEELTFGKLNQAIDMSRLPKGVYFIKIETDKGVIVQKVVKS